MLNENICETLRVVRPESPGGYIVINAADRQPQDIVFEEAGEGEVSLQKRHSKR